MVKKICYTGKIPKKRDEKKAFNGIFTEQQVKNFKKFGRNLIADISYRNGGWFYFIVRMINGAFWLWLSLGFIKAFYYFAIFDRVPITPEQYETIQLIIFVVSAVFLLLRGLTTVPIRDEDKD